MGNSRNTLMVMLSLVLVILFGCGNSSDELSAKSNTQSSNNNSTQGLDDDSSNKDLTDLDKDTTENSSEDANNTEQNDQEDISDNTTTELDNGEPSKSSKSHSEITKSRKDEYLKKLNDTKQEIEEMEVEDYTTYALKKVEGERYDAWDELLNEVYGVLKEQLLTEEMDQLRKEQREWIKYRDATALKASLKFKGGTMEPLEYVSVLANLTEKRCYKLVKNYMK